MKTCGGQMALFSELLPLEEASLQEVPCEPKPATTAELKLVKLVIILEISSSGTLDIEVV